MTADIADAKLARLRNLTANSSLSVVLIAERLGLTRDAVQKAIRKHNLRPARGDVTTWLDEEKEIARRMIVEDGASASEIAKRLKRSRNSVISLVHRHGWRTRNPEGDPGMVKKFRAPEIAKPSRYVPPSGTRPAQMLGAPPPKFDPELVDPAIKGIPLADLDRRSCRWPVTGSFASTLFCGEAQADGCPYCEAHRLKAWTGEKVVDARARKGMRRAA